MPGGIVLQADAIEGKRTKRFENVKDGGNRGSEQMIYLWEHLGYNFLSGQVHCEAVYLMSLLKYLTYGKTWELGNYSV